MLLQAERAETQPYEFPSEGLKTAEKRRQERNFTLKPLILNTNAPGVKD